MRVDRDRYGILTFEKGDYEKAEVFLRAALALQPSNPVLAYMLMRLYLSFKEAREDSF